MMGTLRILGLAVISVCISTEAALADAIAVPEPNSLSSFAIGAIGLLFILRMLNQGQRKPKAV